MKKIVYPFLAAAALLIGNYFFSHQRARYECQIIRFSSIPNVDT